MARLGRAPFIQAPITLLRRTAERKGILFVYAWLWHHAGEQDQAWPSMDTLATECGMKPDDVRASVRWLVASGFVTREERPGKTAMFRVRCDLAEEEVREVPLPTRSSGGPLPQMGDPYPSPRLERGTPPPDGGGEQEALNKKPGTRESLNSQDPPKSPPASGVAAPQAAPGPGAICRRRTGRRQKAPETASGGNPPQQPPQAASGAPGAPLAAASDPSPEPVAAASGSARGQALRAARDPFAAKTLPAQAVPDDLLDVAQLLGEWWSVKGRGRSRVAFDRACGMLRRQPADVRRTMLENAVVGGWQGLHEPRGLRSVSGNGQAGHNGRRLTQSEQATLGALAIIRRQEAANPNQQLGF